MTGLRPKSGIHKIKAHMLSNAQVPTCRHHEFLLNSNESACSARVPAAIEAAKAAASGLARYLENPGALLAPALARQHDNLDPKLYRGWQWFR